MKQQRVKKIVSIILSWNGHMYNEKHIDAKQCYICWNVVTLHSWNSEESDSFWQQNCEDDFKARPTAILETHTLPREVRTNKRNKMWLFYHGDTALSERGSFSCQHNAVLFPALPRHNWSERIACVDTETVQAGSVSTTSDCTKHCLSFPMIPHRRSSDAQGLPRVFKFNSVRLHSHHITESPNINWEAQTNMLSAIKQAPTIHSQRQFSRPKSRLPAQFLNPGSQKS